MGLVRDTLPCLCVGHLVQLVFFDKDHDTSRVRAPLCVFASADMVMVAPGRCPTSAQLRMSYFFATAAVAELPPHRPLTLRKFVDDGSNIRAFVRTRPQNFAPRSSLPHNEQPSPSPTADPSSRRWRLAVARSILSHPRPDGGFPLTPLLLTRPPLQLRPPPLSL